MPTSDELDAMFRESELERRLALVEQRVNQYEYAGLDIFREFGYLQLGLSLPRLDKYGLQVVAPSGAGTGALYFEDKFSANPNNDARKARILGLKNSNTDGTSMFISMVVTDADGDNAVVNVDTSTNEQPTVELQSTLSGTRTTYLTVKAAQDAVSIGGVLLLIDKGTNPSTFPGAPFGGWIWFDDTTDKFRGRINSTNYNFLMEGDVSGAMKTSGGGYYCIPAGPSQGTTVTSGSANNYGSWTELRSASGNALYIIGLALFISVDSSLDYVQIDLGTGAAAAETSIGETKVAPNTYIVGASTVIAQNGQVFMFPDKIPVAASTRIAVRTADDVGSLGHGITLLVVDQGDLVAL